MRIVDGIPIWGDPIDEGALTQIKECAKTADKVAMMGDHHLGYAVPIGGVVAYRNAVSPSGVGFDIGCGNKAVLVDADYDDVRKNISTIMDDVWKIISFGVGRKNEEKVEHPLFDKDHPGWHLEPMKGLKRLAESQLGTVGSGNHYVDIFVDAKKRVWIGVHFGSRGLGHKTATHFLNAAGAKDGMHAPPCVIDAKSQLGQDYVAGMRLAGEYAYAGRDWVCSRVAKILGARIQMEVHNHHNFAWEEIHGGEKYWVVRKGATPAFPGQLGFVGGSMGDVSVIIQGVENPLAEHSMYSTVHGAGRVLGRMQAKGKINRKTGEVIREGLVKQADMDAWVAGVGVELRGAGVDEAPQCYKRLPEVLDQHAGTIEVLETLTPIGVAMAGKEFDPYRD